MVGHIEDCVVEETMRSKGLGRMIVEQLKRLARETGCYKVNWVFGGLRTELALFAVHPGLRGTECSLL